MRLGGRGVRARAAEPPGYAAGVAQPDVIVVGLGSMGAAAAYHLTRRGVRVVGLDRFDPPHGRGAHAGGSRIIRMAYLEGAAYVPLVRRAYALWRELEADSGEALLTTTGGLMLGAASSRTVNGALEAARVHGLPHELLDAFAVRRRFPQFTPAEDEVGLYEEVAGLVRPEAAVAAHLRLAAAIGADLRTTAAVLDWSSTADGVSVRTAEGELRAGRLVLAPGAWAGQLARLRVPMRVQRRIQHYWRPTGDGADFEPGRLPIWIWEYAPGSAAYGLPAVAGAVKAARHHGEDPVDPGTGAEPARPDEIAAMRELLRTRIPRLAEGEWLHGKPCLYTLTPDEHFVIGVHPDAVNAVVACGFSGHGFKFSPVVGEILADLALTGTTAHPIALFDPTRRVA
jgi:sarcosine oxidase